MKIRDLISANHSFQFDACRLALTKASINVTLANPIPITPTIKMASGNVVPIFDFSPKQFYQIFLQQKQIAPATKLKLLNKY